MGYEIIFRAQEMDIKDPETTFRGLEMVDFKDRETIFRQLEMDFKGQERIFKVQETGFLDLGIILEVLGKLSKGLEIILKVQKTDSQDHPLEILGIQESLNLVVEGHMTFLLLETSSRKEAVEDPKILDLNMEGVVVAEEEHEGEEALDPCPLREALEMN
jgi:hypothetical protein